MMTADQNTKTTLYSSPYLAEFYELRWVRDLGLNDVNNVYWPQFAELFSQCAGKKPFTFLDIGTGSGRAIHGLLKKAADASLDISPENSLIIGMDIEQSMLDQAAVETKKYPDIGPITWSLGSALALQVLPPLVERRTTVDFLIFTYGSIAHLTGDGDLEQFFDQVSRVLTPETGRACVSFHELFFIPRGGKRPSPEKDSVFLDGMKKTHVKSTQWPGILYRMETTNLGFEGNTLVIKQRIQAVTNADTVDEKVVENFFVDYGLRSYEEDHVKAASEKAGLQLVEAKSFDDIRYLMFHKSA